VAVILDRSQPMSARRLTPAYNTHLRAQLDEFRRAAVALKESLGDLGMLDIIELIAPPSQSPKSLGLTAAEITLLTPDLDDEGVGPDPD
jgi:hypothetical protein